MFWGKYIVAVAMAGFVAFDSPYGVWALNRAAGAGTSRPDWIALPDKALVISGVQDGRDGAALGKLQFSTTMFDPQLGKFYVETLRARGFTVEDKDMRAIGMATARALGLRRQIIAHDDKTGREARITIRKVDSFLFGHRFVQIAWSRGRPVLRLPVTDGEDAIRFSTHKESF